MSAFPPFFTMWATNKIINKKTEKNKRIVRYKPSDIEAFIERDTQIGSYIISGKNPYQRMKVAGAITYCSLNQGTPVIILHEGNTYLQNHIANVTAFTNNKVIINNNNAIYDPFFNRNKQDICNLIVNSAKKNTSINSSGRQYISGLTDFITIKNNVKPFCDIFMSCPFDSLLDKIDEAQNNRQIAEQIANQIRNQIMQGQSEKDNIKAFFSELYSQSNIISKTTNAVNIKTAVEHNGLIMIDIGSSTNDLLINLIINEIKEILSSGKKIVLLLDDININSNELLAKQIKTIANNCLTTLLSDDVFAMLGADENLFNSYVGKASKCILFSHRGASCNKWAEIIGYYDEIKASGTAGKNNNVQGLYGAERNHSNIFYSGNIDKERRYIVKPEEIANIKQDSTYIIDNNYRELALVILK